jgi:nicotinamide riboside kinase
MTFKIAFVGTHGIGKTTLTHQLVLELKIKGKDVEFLKEVARKSPFPINESRTKKSQVWIILKQILEEIEEEEKSEILTCDRSVLDSYCYYVSKFGQSSALEPLIRQHLKTYDLIVHIPIRNGFLQQDKMRSTNETFQKEIDNTVKKYLQKFKIPHLEISPEKTNKEIVEKVISLIP